MIVSKSKLRGVLTKLSVFTVKDGCATSAPRVLFSAKDGKVSVTSCDGSSIGIFSFDNEDKSNMEFVTEYKSLTAATVLRGDVNMEYANGCITITQGDSKMVFAAQDRDTYPFEDKDVDEDAAITLKGSEIKKLLGKISYARREKDQKLFLTGMYLTASNGELKAECTDSRRIYRNSMETGDGNSKDVSFAGIISPRAIKVVESLEDASTVNIKMDRNAVSFTSDNMKVYLPLINCTYPDTQKFFDSLKCAAAFSLNRDTVEESLEIFAQTENQSLCLKRSGDFLALSSDDGISALSDKIPMADNDGSDFEFVLDTGHFSDLFRNMKEGSKTMHFKYSGPLQAVEVSDDESFNGLIMPLKK